MLGAGGRPLPHLNLDSRAHPRTGAGAKTVFQQAQSSLDKACFSGRYVNAELVGCAFRKCSLPHNLFPACGELDGTVH